MKQCRRCTMFMLDYCTIVLLVAQMSGQMSGHFDRVILFSLVYLENIILLSSFCCHELKLWLRKSGTTWPWEGHVTKLGLSHHVTHHVAKRWRRRLPYQIRSQVTRSASTCLCTLTSVGVTCAMSMTDTRTQQTTKSSTIGSALTHVWVNASQVYPEIQYAHMGTSE
jgi:hypothetical protein